MNTYQIKYKNGKTTLKTKIEATSMGVAETLFIGKFGNLPILGIKDLNA